MTTRNLDSLFAPKSVAVIGATPREGAVGNILMHNLLEAGFEGPIMPVTPNHESVAGVLAYNNVGEMPQVPDLAVICTPPAYVPGMISDLATAGTQAAIVITAGLEHQETADGETLAQKMLDASRPNLLRILGPNCLGLLVPDIGLNASFAHRPALPGHVAFVSQSGALCTAVLDWARPRDVGFSHFISLGNMADVDFGDVVDYLANDPGTHAILLYIEAITNGRKFMSACRAAARNKPVLVIKAGRAAEGAKAAASHTGALAGADAIYDAAIQRAGMLRVFDIDELFAAVETLARAHKQRGDRLAIVTNGGGIGVMAVDALIADGGGLAELDEDTIRALDTSLPETWSHANPVDIIGDAPGERYANAVRTLLDAKDNDALLVMHAPTATADSVDAARAVIEATREIKSKNVLTSWVGGEAVAPARMLFQDAGLPTYDTPEQAARAFMHMVKYRRNQELLMETPPSVPEDFTPATETARLIVEQRLANGANMLNEPEAKAVLAAYGIPTVETHIVATPEDAGQKAAGMGFPVALKILSEDISHKSDVGGVDLFIDSEDAVVAAAKAMQTNVAARCPEARLQGFTVQCMADRPGAHEVIVGVADDPVFGPSILFGHGGTAVEVIGDRAIALPPLNMNLARELISRTRVSRLLAGYRDRPRVDMDALCGTLIKVAQMIVDIPEIAELDINPLLVDEKGVLALDARIKVSPASGAGASRLAIRPYPGELEDTLALEDGASVLIRPIRPEDEPDHYAFLSRLSSEDVRFRFFGQVRALPHTQMARLTQIDYDREMAFLARTVEPGSRDSGETLGVVRTVTDPDNDHAEYAIVVRSDMKGRGLGRRLLEKMIAYCRSRGTNRVIGQVLGDNKAMLGLCKKLGFATHAIPSEGVVEATLEL